MRVEGLLFLLLMFWLFKSSKNKKGKSVKRQKKELHSQLRAGIEKIVQGMVTDNRRPAQQIAMEDVPPTPLQEGQSSMRITQDIHGCFSAREEYMGSLDADTSEGEDACDPSLGHERLERHADESVYAGEIGSNRGIELNPHAIYQGIVMSEILNRPARHVRIRR